MSFGNGRLNQAFGSGFRKANTPPHSGGNTFKIDGYPSLFNYLCRDSPIDPNDMTLSRCSDLGREWEALPPSAKNSISLSKCQFLPKERSHELEFSKVALQSKLPHDFFDPKLEEVKEIEEEEEEEDENLLENLLADDFEPEKCNDPGLIEFHDMFFPAIRRQNPFASPAQINDAIVAMYKGAHANRISSI